MARIEATQVSIRPREPVLAVAVAVIGILLGCFLAMLASMAFVLMGIGSGDTSAASGIHQAIAAGHGGFMTFVVVGALPFALMTLLFHTISLYFLSDLLPRRAWGWWAVATFVGAVGYWVLCWTLFLYPLRDLINTLINLPLPSGYPDPPILSAELGVIVGGGALLGDVIGVLSGVMLSGLQWLVLRPYSKGVLWWVLITSAVSGMVVAVLLPLWILGAKTGGL
jgi:hypothetical protein